MTAERVYTKHGFRAHYALEFRQTLCGREAVELEERSRFFRRRLRMASMCYVCEKLEEAMGK